MRFACCFLLILGTALSGPGHTQVDLKGKLTQGGIVIGHAIPGSTVSLDEENVRVSESGSFVIGFDRDAPATALLVVTTPDGSSHQRQLQILPREYEIQRIDGLPPASVTPPPEVLERIRREAALVGAARKRDDPREDFAATFVWPAKGPISGVYGSQRVLNGEPKRPHYGVDVAADAGDPVFAPAPGIVTLAEQDLYYSGGTVILDHGHSLSSTFLHMQAVHVEVGQQLSTGDLIGEVGAAGRATGPHLDWRMNWQNRRVDPQSIVTGSPEEVSE